MGLGRDGRRQMESQCRTLLASWFAAVVVWSPGERLEEILVWCGRLKGGLRPDRRVPYVST